MISNTEFPWKPQSMQPSFRSSDIPKNFRLKLKKKNYNSDHPPKLVSGGCINQEEKSCLPFAL